MSTTRLAPVARRFALSVRPLTTSSVRFADPYPLPFSDPALASAASRSPQNPDALSEHDEWPILQPLDRSHEDEKTLRARLVYQTRKRGTLESDLILSTFARDQLGEMNLEELQEFDKVSPLFLDNCIEDGKSQKLMIGQMLDEPDWDIFYWSVLKREPPPRWKDTALLAK